MTKPQAFALGAALGSLAVTAGGVLTQLVLNHSITYKEK